MSEPSPAASTRQSNGLAQCLAVVLLIKGAWLVFDPSVRLFLGDSGSYLHTALTGWIPPDRSFLYGWLLEATALRAQSIYALLLTQTLFGIVGALLLYVWLVRGVKVRHGVALAAAGLFALDPAQLFYERMMMAEATGLLAFLLFFGALSAYVASGRWLWIPLYAAAGVLAVAFRVNLLAVVLVLSVLAPMICVVSAWRGEAPRVRLMLRGAAHLLLAAVCTVAAHNYYKAWYGQLANTAPGYSAMTGVFRLALVAPLIEPAHFRNTGVSPEVLQEVKLDYRDPHLREAQIWSPDGLHDVLRRHTADPDRVARKISIRAAREHPFGLVRMGLATVADYFQPEIADFRLEDDLGRRGAHQGLIDDIRKYLRYDVTDLHRIDTPAVHWFRIGSVWLTACLFGLAPLALFVLWRGRHAPQREVRLLLALTSLGLVVGHVLFSHIVSFRYLHPLPWFVLANLALLIASWARSPATRLALGKLSRVRNETPSSAS